MIHRFLDMGTRWRTPYGWFSVVIWLGCGEENPPQITSSTGEDPIPAEIVESLLPEDSRFPLAIVDAQDLSLESQDVVIRVGVPMDSNHHLRITGFGSYDEQTGMPAVGDRPQINRLVDLQQDGNPDPGVVEIELQLEPLLWYMASVGLGPTPQSGDYHGPLQQLVPGQHYLLHVGHMRLD